jgi:uncharacterized protein with PIN domain
MEEGSDPGLVNPESLVVMAECPKCGAKPGERCNNTIWRGSSHWERIVKSIKKAQEVEDERR